MSTRLHYSIPDYSKRIQMDYGNTFGVGGCLSVGRSTSRSVYQSTWSAFQLLGSKNIFLFRSVKLYYVDSLSCTKTCKKRIELTLVANSDFSSSSLPSPSVYSPDPVL